MKSKPKNNGFSFACLQSGSGPQIVPYKLERSHRIKRMRLQIDSGRFVTLKMPARMAEKRGLRFLEEHGEWICRTLSACADVPSLRQYLLRHPRVALGGRWYKLEMATYPGISQFEILTPQRLVRFILNPRRQLEAQLEALLRQLARTSLPERLRALAVRAGVKVHGVTVRDQRCRWGSCSETGAISLNWRLILVSPRLQDHVLLHELAHLKHFDHSRDFHAFLNALDPRSAENARRLNDEADRIINLGRAAL